MGDLREVFEMATKQMDPDQDSWREQERRQRRKARNRKVSAIALVAALVIGVVTVAWLNRSGTGTAPATVVPTTTAADPKVRELSSVDVRSGERTAFTVPLDATDLDLSPDGSMVAYSGLDKDSSAQVFVMDADGSDARQLTHGVGGARGPRWSADSSMIAYERTTSNDSQIFVVRVSDGVSTKVTREPRGAVDPGGWTPDGRSMVVSSINAAGDHYTARSLDLATGNTRLIVPDASTPTLSPDGAWIAFNSWLKPPGARLILAKSDGSERRVIARSLSDDGYQEWSPDSTQIAYIDSAADGTLHTYVYDLATGEAHSVTAGSIESWIDDDHVLVS